jgi:sulfite exporter TauE/SafE
MVIDSAFQTSYLVAFIMGLFSSLHCVGMCGSIIGTLTLSLKPEIRKNKARLLFFVFNYNLGRVLSYSIAGLLAGIIGSTLTLPFAEGQGYRVLQIASAVIMTCAGLYIAGWFPGFAYIEKAGSKLWKLLEPFGRNFIPVKKLHHAFLFGMIWGWLPCGLVYAALALAITSGNVVQSALTMLVFGLGTLPAVIGVGIIGGMLSKLVRMNRFKQTIGILLIVLALFSALPWLNPMRLQHI